MNRLRILIENIIREYLCEEGRFTGGPDPHNSRSHRERNVGNPIIGHGNGSHSNQDVVSQPSTYDILVPVLTANIVLLVLISLRTIWIRVLAVEK